MRKIYRPIFAQALGEDWERLAPSVQAHYNLPPKAMTKFFSRD